MVQSSTESSGQWICADEEIHVNSIISATSHRKIFSKGDDFKHVCTAGESAWCSTNEASWFRRHPSDIKKYISNIHSISDEVVAVLKLQGVICDE